MLIERIKIKKRDYNKCLPGGCPVECGRIKSCRIKVFQIQSGKHKKGKRNHEMDEVRQKVDRVMSFCTAVKIRQGKIGTSGANLDGLPCNNLRKRIMIDELYGDWYEPWRG